jgi:hypothetical protein
MADERRESEGVGMDGTMGCVHSLHTYTLVPCTEPPKPVLNPDGGSDSITLNGTYAKKKYKWIAIKETHNF